MKEDFDKKLSDNLKIHFGFDSFHPFQREIIKDILDGRDVFVLMPTGGGKSLCYQFPSTILDGLTLVISPLIALMKDQVDGLRRKGISAARINSSLNIGEILEVESSLLKNKIKILYVAPERIANPSFLEILKRIKISLIAIDEAHCVSEWGHDFRPEYRNLKLLRDFSPKAPVIAMTATAVSEVQEDLLSQLNLNHPKIYKRSLNRKNLFYEVRKKNTNSFIELINYLSKHKKDCGIIYCYSRKSVESLAGKLQELNYQASAYHAGMNSKIREEVQNKFIKEEIKIVVATIAFGMGIDKSNIRFVIHYNLPKNLESYYQETGRAGRDGNPSDCILFFSEGDRRKIEYFIEKKEGTQKEIAEKKLNEMIKFCEFGICRRRFLLNYFGEYSKTENCGNCDVCLKEKSPKDRLLFIPERI